MCTYVCVPLNAVPMQSRRGHWTDRYCEQSDVRVCDPALCLLEEQCVLLPPESSLQNLYVLHLQNSSDFKHYGEREETGLFF